MRAAIKITFFDDNDEKFFGEGPYRLLLAIEETGSLRSASKSMGLAYSKAFRMIIHVLLKESLMGCMRFSQPVASEQNLPIRTTSPLELFFMYTPSFGTAHDVIPGICLSKSEERSAGIFTYKPHNRRQIRWRKHDNTRGKGMAEKI